MPTSSSSPLPPSGYLPPSATPARRNSKLSIVSLVISLLSFLTLGLTSLVGLICGHIALHRIKKHHLAGKGLAMTGTILGYVGVVFFIFLAGWLLPPAINGALLSANQVALQNDLKSIQVDFNAASEARITSAGEPLGWPANSSVTSKVGLIEKYRSGEVQSQLAQLSGSGNSPTASGLIPIIAPENLAKIQITNCAESDPPSTIVAFKPATRSDPVGGVVLRDGRCFTFLAESGRRPTDFGTLPERIPQVLAD